MAAKKTGSTKKPSGGHTPVSNLSIETGEAAAVKATVSKPPSEGTNPRTSPPRENGIENVKDFKLREVGAQGLAELFTVPDTSKLPISGKLPSVRLRHCWKRSMVRMIGFKSLAPRSIRGALMHRY